MNLSELIARIGDENVEFQRVDDAVSSLQTTKHGTRAAFVTPQSFDLDGFHKLGLIVWLDRDAVARALRGSPTIPHPETVEPSDGK